jgi:hypothetical protein
VSGSLAGLLAAQLLYVAVGTGLLPLLRIVPGRGAPLARFGLAYMVGLAATGILAAHLALLDVPLGLLELFVLAAVSVALGARRLRRNDRARAAAAPAWRFGRASLVAGLGALAVLLVLLVHAARVFAVRPLVEWDGWAIWATKARALYEFGGVYEPVFTTYPPLQHPLFLPSVEAIAFRAIGAFDGTLIHVQLIALAFGFAAALWGLLGDRVPPVLLGVTVLAILAAEPVLPQLSTNLADVPLAFLVALGVAALGRHLLTGEAWCLVPAALLLGAAMLTKPEGTLFCAAALLAAVGALAMRARERIGGVLVAGGAAVAILVPWRIYLAVHGLENPEYSFSDALRPGYLADRGERVGPAARELWASLSAPEWGLLVPLALVSIVAALLARSWRLAAFAALWPALAFAGLVLVYWISVVPVELTLLWTAERTVTSIAIGAAALAPLLVAEAWPQSGSHQRERPALRD